MADSHCTRARSSLHATHLQGKLTRASKMHQGPHVQEHTAEDRQSGPVNAQREPLYESPLKPRLHDESQPITTGQNFPGPLVSKTAGSSKGAQADAGTAADFHSHPIEIESNALSPSREEPRSLGEDAPHTVPQLCSSLSTAPELGDFAASVNPPALTGPALAGQAQLAADLLPIPPAALAEPSMGNVPCSGHGLSHVDSLSGSPVPPAEPHCAPDQLHQSNADVCERPSSASAGMATCNPMKQACAQPAGGPTRQYSLKALSGASTAWPAGDAQLSGEAGSPLVRAASAASQISE